MSKSGKTGKRRGRRLRSLRVTLGDEPEPVQLSPEDAGRPSLAPGASEPPEAGRTSEGAASAPAPALDDGVFGQPSHGDGAALEDEPTVVEARGTDLDEEAPSVEVDVGDFESDATLDDSAGVVVQRVVRVESDPAPPPEVETPSESAREVEVDAHTDAEVVGHVDEPTLDEPVEEVDEVEEVEEVDDVEGVQDEREVQESAEAELAEAHAAAESEVPSDPSLDVELAEDDGDDQPSADEAGAEPRASGEDEADLEELDLDLEAAPASQPPSRTGEAEVEETPPPPPPKVASRTPPPPPPDVPPLRVAADAPPPPDAPTSPPPPPTATGATVATPPPRPKSQWWEDLFDADYLRTVPIPRPKNIARQCDFIISRLDLPPGSTILDVGCGLGLHAVELTRRGYLVVGLDLSKVMIDHARAEAAEHGLNMNFLQADMREMTFEGGFDAVLCWGTTFGYFDDETNRKIVQRMFDALRVRGLLLLDVVNRDFVIRNQPNLVWFEGDGCVVMEETQCNFISSRLQVKRTVMLDDGRQHETMYSLRLYSLHELGQILHQQGFRVVEASGHTGHPGVYFGADSPQLIIVAERRPPRPVVSKAPSGRFAAIGRTGTHKLPDAPLPPVPATPKSAPELSLDDVEPVDDAADAAADDTAPVPSDRPPRSEPPPPPPKAPSTSPPKLVDVDGDSSDD